MKSLLVTRRRAEEFARLLDEQRRSHDPNVAHLLALVTRLTPAPVEPAPAFRDSLRERLVSAAHEANPSAVPAAPDEPVSHTRSRTRTSARWVAVAASVVVAGGMVGTAAAARQAMPGDTLYGIKLGLERTQVAVSTNEESRGREYLKQAEQRLQEVSALIGGGYIPNARAERIQLIDAALTDFATLANKGGELLVVAYDERDSAAAMSRLAGFTAQSMATLDRDGKFLPPPLYDSHNHAIGVLRGLEDRVRTVCPECLDPAAAAVLEAAAAAPKSVPGNGSAGSSAPADDDMPGSDDSVILADGERAPRGNDPGPAPGDSEPGRAPSQPLPDRPGPTGEPPRGPDRDRLPSEPLPGPTLKLPLPLPTIGDQPRNPAPSPTSTATAKPSNPVPLPTTLPSDGPKPVPNSLPLPRLPLPLPLPTALPLPPILSGANTGPAGPPHPGEPTSTPTSGEPTGLPTDPPSDDPTDSPTGEPTASPTVPQTVPPTGPTSKPTIDPTAEPTSGPTSKPTADPTGEPTAEPTAEPTDAPTDAPTRPDDDPTDGPINDWPSIVRNLPLSAFLYR